MCCVRRCAASRWPACCGLQKGVKGGAFIREGDTSRMNVVMRDMLSLGTISVRELSEARIDVLDLVVRLACTNARQADFEALEANIERTELATREGRLLDRVECSREFYRLLAASTGNKVIAMIMDSVTEIHMRFVYAKVVVERRRDGAAGGKATAIPGGAARAERRGRDALDARPSGIRCSGCWSRIPARCRFMSHWRKCSRDAPLAERAASLRSNE